MNPNSFKFYVTGSELNERDEVGGGGMGKGGWGGEKFSAEFMRGGQKGSCLHHFSIEEVIVGRFK